VDTLIIRPRSEQLNRLPELAQPLSQKFQANPIAVEEDDLTAMGLALWQALTLELDVLPPARLLIEGDEQVQRLPWECLYHPQLGFLAKHPEYTLSRRLLTQPPISLLGSRELFPNTDPVPLKILLFTAHPEDLTQRPLAPEIDQYYVQSALRPWIEAGKIKLAAPNDGRFTTFIELLHTQPWHIVIWSGHSVRFSNCLKFGQSALIFENEEGNSDFISADQFALAFKETAVSAVVIAACQSKTLLATLLTAGISPVVGMREPLIDRAGSIFLQAFCVALAQRAPMDVAVQRGRQAMVNLLQHHEVWYSWSGQPINDPGVGQWSLPVLFTDHGNDLDRFAKSQKFGQSESTRELPNLANLRAKEILVGRRRELRYLEPALRAGTIRRLLIRGEAGIGKTALAKHLITQLTAQEEYRVLKWSEIESQITGDNQTDTFSIREQIHGENQPQISYLLWLEDWNADNHHRIAKILELSPIEGYTDHLRILLTSRYSVPPEWNFYDYYLTRPCYQDFLSYTQQLGLPHSSLQIRLIYEVLNGNFQGVQLLHSLPVCTTGIGFRKQLALVKRYLQAL